ncbi:MAG: LamG domain-containing protein, partial [Victivallales bacterium]|nr:LamG domain-containing protein [Victivallales bacterium]
MRHAIALALGFASFTLFAAPERPTRGLLGHWDFTEVMGGLSPDGSDTGDDAELQGASQVQGPFGKALAFAGNGAAVIIPGLPELDGSEEMTVSCWVLWQETGQYPNIVTGGVWSPGGFLIFVKDDTCSFRMGRPGHSASRAGDQWREISSGLVRKIVMGRWYHLAATLKRPNIVTYVNGKRVGAARWDHPVGHEGDIRLGTWGGKNTHKGLIDELKLHNQALTAAEIQAEFAATQQGRNPEGQSPAWQPAPEDRNRAPIIATYKTAASELTVDTLGRIASLRSLPDGRELIRAPMPLVALQRERRRLTGRTCRKEGDELAITLRRGGGEVRLKITPRKRHFRIELTKVPEGDSLTFGQVAAETTQDA